MSLLAAACVGKAAVNTGTALAVSGVVGDLEYHTDDEDCARTPVQRTQETVMAARSRIKIRQVASTAEAQGRRSRSSNKEPIKEWPITLDSIQAA